VLKAPLCVLDSAEVGSCYARALVNRSANAMANWFIAADHARVAWLQSVVVLRSASQISFVAASSDGFAARLPIENACTS